MTEQTIAEVLEMAQAAFVEWHDGPADQPHTCIARTGFAALLMQAHGYRPELHFGAATVSDGEGILINGNPAAVCEHLGISERQYGKPIEDDPDRFHCWVTHEKTIIDTGFPYDVPLFLDQSDTSPIVLDEGEVDPRFDAHFFGHCHRRRVKSRLLVLRHSRSGDGEINRSRRQRQWIANRADRRCRR